MKPEERQEYDFELFTGELSHHKRSRVCSDDDRDEPEAKARKTLPMDDIDWLDGENPVKLDTKLVSGRTDVVNVVLSLKQILNGRIRTLIFKNFNLLL